MHRLPSARSRVRRLGLPIAVVALVSVVAACGGGAASPSASASQKPAPEDPTPVIPSASPIAGGTYWLRMTTFQAIPPVNLFAVTPTVVIDGSGQLIVPGAVPAIFPGPLVMPLFARQVSETGRATILGWAKELGLLSGATDFTGGGGLPGGVTGRIELTVDGKLVALSGIPDAAASVEPGTPGAFAELWRRISTLSETLPGELGAEAPYTPTAYAVLVGPAPDPQGMPAQIAVWPLDVAIGDFGGPVAGAGYRCGIAEGDDAVKLGSALATATQITQWIPTATASATFGLTVRPIVAGENPCAEVFGS